jgi:hypothetical protein
LACRCWCMASDRSRNRSFRPRESFHRHCACSADPALSAAEGGHGAHHDQDAAEFVANSPLTVAATITAHHLLYNRNAIFQGGVRPHWYCLPVLKRETHRAALVAAATSGNPKFFLGTDSAPHAKGAKEAACGCAGCYTAYAALELYAEAFEQAGRSTSLKPSPVSMARTGTAAAQSRYDDAGLRKTGRCRLTILHHGRYHRAFAGRRNLVLENALRKTIMRLRHLILPLLAVPLLTACVNDGATYEIDNTREHVLSLIREQPYFWDSKVNLYLVVSRMPACMRRHSMGPGRRQPGLKSIRCRPAPSSSRLASACTPPRRRPAKALPRWTPSRLRAWAS